MAVNCLLGLVAIWENMWCDIIAGYFEQRNLYFISWYLPSN